MNVRKTYMDVLRILAIWLVIFDHTKEYGFTLFTQVVGSRIYWVYLMFSILGKTAVPLFWMISGALLLNRTETLRVILKKRVLRFVVVLFIFSLIQYIFYIRSHHTTFLAREFLGGLYGAGWTAGYWFLYAYIAFLLLLPVLRKLVMVLSEQDFFWLFLLYALFCGLVPLIEFFIWHGDYSLTKDFMIQPLLFENIMFPLFGYFVEYRMKASPENLLKFLIPAGIGTMILTAGATTYRCLYTSDFSPVFSTELFNTMIFVPTLAIYLLAKALGNRFRDMRAGDKILEICAGAVFGVMLIENLVSDRLEVTLNPILRSTFGPLLSCILWVTVTLLISMGIVILVRLIPCVKKWI